MKNRNYTGKKGKRTKKYSKRKYGSSLVSSARRLSNPNKIYSFRQMFIPGTGNVQLSANATYTAAGQLIPTAVNVDSTWGFQFTLNDLVQVSTLTSLFDQYKINGIKLTFYPKANVDISSISNLYGGRFLTVYDFDDNTAPATISALRQYNTCRETETFKKHVRYLKPHIANAAYGGGVFTSYSNKRASWIDSASPAVSHYGIKCGLTASATGGAFIVYDVIATMYVSFKNVN